MAELVPAPCPMCHGTGLSPEADFARKVREAREAAGMTQPGLAEALASRGLFVDPTAITRLERGHRMIRLNEAIALAEILDVRFT